MENFKSQAVEIKEIKSTKWFKIVLMSKKLFKIVSVSKKNYCF